MKEKNVNRYVILIVLAIGAGSLYLLPYLRWTYYDALRAATGLTNTQFAATLSMYGLSSMFFYGPGGYLADKFSPRKLLALAFAGTGLLGFWYLTYPGFIIQMIIFFLWGVLGTACFWSAMLKVAKSLGNSEEQGRMFGFLEGSRGLISVTISFASLFLFNKLGAAVAGLSGIIIADSILCLIAAVLVWFFVSDKITGNSSNIHLKDIGTVLKIPAVWIISIIVLACYSVFVGSTYLTPYLTEMMGLTVSMAAVVAILRNYGFQLIGGPIGGIIADKIGSITFVIVCCFVLLAVSMAGFLLLPATTALLFVALGLMLVYCIGMFLMRGIYFAPLDQCKVPKHLSGTAIGVISVIGFTPDVFMNAIAGSLMDKYPGITGYKYLFLLLLLICVVGLIASLILNHKVKKETTQKAQGELTQA